MEETCIGIASVILIAKFELVCDQNYNFDEKSRPDDMENSNRKSCLSISCL